MPRFLSNKISGLGLSLLFTSAHAFNLLNYQLLGAITKLQAQQRLQQLPPFVNQAAHFDSQLYKITYKTKDPIGKPTQASSLVTIPMHLKKPLPIVMYFHGTRVLHNDVPSRKGLLSNYDFYSAIFSSANGWMLVMPDYLGYGDNLLNLHPYVDAPTIASASIDALIAAKELAQQLAVPINRQLFLAGYSEGGFSTMAVLEALEKDFPRLPVTAAAPGAGPYDLDQTLPYILFKAHNGTFYSAFYLYSLSHYKQYWSHLSEVFLHPYDQIIPNLFDGHHDINTICAALPENSQTLLQPDLIKAFAQGTEPHLDQLRREFNRSQFVPKASLMLVGSRGDTDVPFSNSDLAYDIFRLMGCDVALQSVSDVQDHQQAFLPVIFAQVEFFKKKLAQAGDIQPFFCKKSRK